MSIFIFLHIKVQNINELVLDYSKKGLWFIFSEVLTFIHSKSTSTCKCICDKKECINNTKNCQKLLQVKPYKYHGFLYWQLFTWLNEADLIFGCIKTQNETMLPDIPKAEMIRVMMPFTHHFKLIYTCNDKYCRNVRSAFRIFPFS